MYINFDIIISFQLWSRNNIKVESNWPIPGTIWNCLLTSVSTAVVNMLTSG